ncbi:MAG TPA: hypothetical protein VMT47_04350 [Polyangia bacterium]|nr:hypothetical protein [Polyangia bacterium]
MRPCARPPWPKVFTARAAARLPSYAITAALPRGRSFSGTTMTGFVAPRSTTS